MAGYRLYTMDGAGRITSADWIDAPTDADAVAAARAMKPSTKCELWNQDRLVATIPPSRKG